MAAFGPNDTIRVGVLGPGSRGMRLVKQCIQEGEQYNARVTAICDIWNRRREEAVRPIEEVYGAKAKAFGSISLCRCSGFGWTPWLSASWCWDSM